MKFWELFKCAKRQSASTIQIFVGIVVIGGAALCVIQQARQPHIIWDRTNNPEPWNKFHPTYQYKFVAMATNHKNPKKKGSDF